jgi:signal transduction histidine kinase
MHPTLERQIKKFLRSTIPVENWEEFLKAVSNTYEHYEENRKLIERSMKLSSTELIEGNKNLQSEINNSKKTAEQLRTQSSELQKIKEDIEKKVQERSRELFEERSRLKASINSLNIGFIMTDVDFNILNINSVAQQIIFNEGPTGVLKKPTPSIADITIDTIQEKLKDYYDLKTAIAYCLQGKNAVKKPDILFGNKYLRIFISPIIIVSEQFKVIGCDILIEDITEQKMTERSKDEFFSIASHELRTPLTAIRSNTALVRDYYGDKITDPDIKQIFEDIHEASIRLITIVNDFLNTSRLEQGRMQFKKEAFNITDIVNQSIKDIETLANEKNISLKLIAPDEKLVVVADPDKSKEILLNLIGNAIKFTEIGGVTIELIAEPTDISIKVTDTGKGIPLQNQNLLFRKFQQASDNILTRDTTRSSGLGLYIAKLMTEGMGGTIYLEKSEENKGTVFIFTLPKESI